MHIPRPIPRLLPNAAALFIPWFSFFLLDIFVSQATGAAGTASLLFSSIWAVVFSGVLFLLPQPAARIVFCMLYFPFAVYAIIQAGYYRIFGKFMWLTDLLYLRDGAEFAGSVFDYLSVGFVAACVLLLAWGVAACILRPKTQTHRPRVITVACILASLLSCTPYLLNNISFSEDKINLGLGTDYYAGKSQRRAYELMYDAEKVYAMCGLYQTAGRDIVQHIILPQLPGNKSEETQKLARIEAYFAQRGAHQDNDMTGLLAGKNVILVLMESADDWTINEQTTPTICKLMQEGIHFTNMYTPLYGSVRTFNTEFTMNTSVFSPTDGSLTFTYCGNDYSESLPNVFRRAGYSANAFHYNSPTFYSRDIMDPAMGYESYICYADYAKNSNQFSRQLCEDSFVLTNPGLENLLLGNAPFFNMIISRNAHMPYSDRDSVSRYAIEKYPQYKDIDTCDEVGYYYAKMNLLDDFFAELLDKLEARDILDDTVIIGVTDHYSYSMKDQDRVLALSDVPVALMVEKTPFFIWSADMQPVTVKKTINTADIVPTLLNLFGMDFSYQYIGQDAFDPDYSGYAIFSDGSWINGNIVYQDGAVIHKFYDGANIDLAKMNETAQQFIEISNLILETDYYAQD